MTDEIISRQTEQNARKAVLATLILLGIYFLIRFYWNVLGFIELWVSPEFVDLFKALFNLAILLLVGAVFVHQLRGLREQRGEWTEETGDETGTDESAEEADESAEDGEDEGEDESVGGSENDAEEDDSP